ncbi:MAG: ATP phosphoribosyltransferase regulatory subunit, partial [Thermoleophilaceae bacterium]|nr:ATP phosphoribosyltransferase regulatory subunit [Thermoleophilaceae bacterium]
EVATPALEFEETMRLGDPRAAERAYHLTDNDGSVLVARFDSTIPLARMAATTFADQPAPLRLCYLQNILRPVEPKRGQSREFLQIGMELMGVGAPAGDAEAIALLCKVLEAAGIEGFKIAVGDGALFGELLDAAGLGGAENARMREAIMYELESRDLVGLERELRASAAIDAEACTRLIEVAAARGGAELLPRFGADRLATLSRQVEAAGVAANVVYDLGLIRSQGYYTGTVLEIYADDYGSPLGGGGRYDELVGRFGRELSAFGFALNLDRICRAREAQKAATL